jgi:hypothetical protein
LPRLQAYRRAVAGEFGRFGLVTVTEEATGVDALTTVISTQLLGVDLGPTRLAQGWAYFPETPYSQVAGISGQQRRLRDAPLDGGAGSISLVAPLSGVAPVGAEVELLAPIPAIRDMDRDGWREYINRALSKLTIRDRVSLPATGAYSYGLTTYPWLADVDRITGLYRTPSGWTQNPLQQFGRPVVRYDGETTFLETDEGWGTGDTLHLAVRRPADTRIRRGGVWTDTAGGDDALTEDSDEVVVPVNTVKLMAIREALKARHRWAPHGEREAWEVEAMQEGAKAAAARNAYEGYGSQLVRSRTRTYGGTWSKNWSP